MATMRDIRRRIRAVDNTKQITRAMYMVAAAKLKKSEEQVKASRPYGRKIGEMLSRLAATEVDVEHPLLTVRPHPQRIAYVVFTGDRGLCGSYNASILRFAWESLKRSPGEAAVVAVGRKGRDYFARRGVAIESEYVNLGEAASLSLSRQLASGLMEGFLAGRMDEVRLIYSEFVSALTQRPVEVRLLPLAGFGTAGEAGGDDRGRAIVEYLYEPSAEVIFQDLLPRFVEIQVYRAFMEAKAAEQGARMTAMKNATDNAEEMIKSLTLEYNRARQAAITKEIVEIVGGAEALRG